VGGNLSEMAVAFCGTMTEWQGERRKAMNSEPIVLPGLVRPDGTLEVPGKVGLTPGPVEVTVRPLSATAPPAGDWWQVVQQLRVEQAASGYVPPGAGEIDAQINALRNEWEDQQLARERMQEQFREAREKLPPSAEKTE
jgi:hypothetical protein